MPSLRHFTLARGLDPAHWPFRGLCAGLLVISIHLFVHPFPAQATNGTEQDSWALASGDTIGEPLGALLAELLAEHPELQSARHLTVAAQSAAEGAGALPDPVVGVGLSGLPLSELDISAEMMTMFEFEVMQDLLPRGLRDARTEAAVARVAAADARERIVEWDLRLRLSEAWFDLLLVSEAIGVHDRTVSALMAFSASAEVSYAEGVAPQADMLRAQTELASLEEHLAELRRLRAAALAQVNTLLGRAVRTPVPVSVPEGLRVLRAADPGMGMLTARLEDAELGAGLPTLAELEALALLNRPELALRDAELSVARAEAEVARIERRPGIRLRGGYGLRSGRSDMISLGLSVPIPIFRSRKQDRWADAAAAEAEAEVHDRHALQRTIQREVTEAHARLVEAREQLVLLEEGVLPQARATVRSSAAAYQAGEGSFTGLMEAQTVLFRSEIQHAHLTAGLGQYLARLEWAVGFALNPETDR